MLKLRLRFYFYCAILLFKFANSSINDKFDSVDCLLCAQGIPVCPECDDGETCFIIKQSCYQCSRAVCAKIKYKFKKKKCKSRNIPVCDCTTDETCIITLRNRIQCSSTICIGGLVDADIPYLIDYPVK